MLSIRTIKHGNNEYVYHGDKNHGLKGCMSNQY